MFRFLGLIISVVAGMFAIDNIESTGDDIKQSSPFYSGNYGMHTSEDDEAYQEYLEYRDELIDSYDLENLTVEEQNNAWSEIRELLAIKADELGIYIGHMDFSYNQYGRNRGFGHMGGYYYESEAEMINYMIELADIVVESDYVNLSVSEKEIILNEISELDDFQMNSYMVSYMLEDEGYIELLGSVYNIDWDVLTEEQVIEQWNDLINSANNWSRPYGSARIGRGLGGCH